MAFLQTDLIQYMDDDAKGITSVIFKEASGGYNNILPKIPIDPVKRGQGTDKVYTDEGPSSAISSRSLYGGWNEGTPSPRNQGWKIGNYGSRADIDELEMMQEGGDRMMADAMMLKGQAMNRNLNWAIVKGDTAVNPNGMDGAAKQVYAGNVFGINAVDSAFSNGANVTNGNVTAGAGNLQQAQRALLEGIDRGFRMVGGVNNPNTYMIANDDFLRVVTKAVRDLGWFGTNGEYYDKQVDSFGPYKFLTVGSRYAVTNYYDSIRDANAIIPNNMTSGSNNLTTEAWFIRFGIEDGFHLKQLRGLKVVDLGRIPAAPVYTKEISWYVGAYAKTPNCIARLTGVQAVAAAQP